jgi:Fe-S cluster assembly ATP-binding protein
MRVVARGVTSWIGDQKACLLITHYQRLLDYIKPNVVHVCIDGQIALSGGPELALELEEKGYDWLTRTV